MEPVASRPHMPGYGTLPADRGTGLLPWTWALARLRESHDFWLATVWPDGRPHLTPVWAVWDDGALWFSSSPRSRKIRNIRAGSAVSVSTEDPESPVILAGRAELVTENDQVLRFVAVVNVKYRTEYPVEFFSPDQAVVARIRPAWAFGLVSSDFDGSPTRWVFPPG
ncbi:MAG: pyridoxamine 5'-phosphate oxidase [Actinophytocola sp.]|uniref:pyridoxamine 5'-phosphate oxidase family protein n=1 Tax=Actinophytocola sp. TaxID=1872138 RepID=UPI0013290DA8|nr:pyridoxamine 5'-phosphate oxidase family protein [Actinophytocola sp.]MPZ84460.1 pyridoxamine 5'-phosphate oxidase [Actinophytocola sp.]